MNTPLRLVRGHRLSGVNSGRLPVLPVFSSGKQCSARGICCENLVNQALPLDSGCMMSCALFPHVPAGRVASATVSSSLFGASRPSRIPAVHSKASYSSSFRPAAYAAFKEQAVRMSSAGAEAAPVEVQSQGATSLQSRDVWLASQRHQSRLE